MPVKSYRRAGDSSSESQAFDGIRGLTPLAVYVHIPFCRKRCIYCDFNTYAGQEALIPAYVEALRKEIEELAWRSPPSLAVHSIYFGGGTPSLLSPSQIEKILQILHINYHVASDVEITLEANPGTVNRDYLRSLRSLGINRLSLGVQSTHSTELRQLGRLHRFPEVIESVKWARQAGFANLNLDLIYGLPEQDLSHWQTNLRRAVHLQPEHLSLYSLTIEPPTPLGRWLARGLIPPPDSDLAADMYEWAGEYLEKQGYEQYEISNWSRPGYPCRHNLTYWRNQSYLGFGAGAHGYAGGFRYSNVQRPRLYLNRLSSPNSSPNRPFPLSSAVERFHRPSQREEMQETMMLGLRLVREGVSERRFAERFGLSLNEAFKGEIDSLIARGLLEQISLVSGEEEHIVLRLSRRGRLLGNQVFMQFVEG